MSACKVSDSPLDWAGKAVLITGGTGSFGRGFVDVMLRSPASELLHLIPAEYDQFSSNGTRTPASHHDRAEVLPLGLPAAKHASPR